MAFNATVAGQSALFPTSGTVSFADNGNLLSSVELEPAPADGLAQYSDCLTIRTCLTVGSHVITATYSGDGVPASHNGSASSSVTVTITKGNPTMVSVRVPAATAIAGQSVNLNTFLIFGPFAIPPSGAVQFLDGTTPLGPPVFWIHLETWRPWPPSTPTAPIPSTPHIRETAITIQLLLRPPR
jgi:hypothetical protein